MTTDRELVEKISYKIQDDREQNKRGLEYMPSEVDSPDDIAKYFIDLVSNAVLDDVSHAISNALDCLPAPESEHNKGYDEGLNDLIKILDNLRGSDE